MQLVRPGGAAIAAALLGVLVATCGFSEPPIDPLTAEAPLHITVPPIAGKTAVMDIMAVDQSNHLLWVADGTDLGIDTFDISSVPGRYVSTIPVGALPNGLVIAADLNRLYSGDDDSTVAVIDIDPHSKTFNTIIARIQIDAEGRSDLIDYDPKDRKVFVTNPDSGVVTAIDATTNTVEGKVGDLHRIDQPRYDPANGMLYVTGVDDNVVYKIDPRTDQLVSTTTIPITCEPHGIAISSRNNQGIIGCADRDDARAAVWDFNTDRMVRTFDQSGAGDAVIYNSKVDQFFFAASNYAPPELSIFAAGPNVNYLTSVRTSHKSHTVAYDESHNLIYTYNGQHGQAELWAFPNPAVGKH